MSEWRDGADAGEGGRSRGKSSSAAIGRPRQQTQKNVAPMGNKESIANNNGEKRAGGEGVGRMGCGEWGGVGGRGWGAQKLSCQVFMECQHYVTEC